MYRNYVPEKVRHRQIIKDPHITIVHCSTNTSQEIQIIFISFRSIEVTVSNLLKGKDTATTEASYMKMLSITEALFKCTSDFVHMIDQL